MNTEKLNQYLVKYLKNDKTERAIMLTAPWGSGKSYYIKNELCLYLREQNLTYAVVSLYGLRDIQELNKSLYLELRFNKLQLKKDIDEAAKIFCRKNSNEAKAIGSIILKGIANFFKMDFSDKNLEKLYKSVNLKDKLIIFEDIERSGIDLIEFLGYVNNLVETDGIKILLIANEEELLKNEQYKQVKEKTVGDTIKFINNRKDTIQNMFNKFNNNNIYLKKLLNNDMVYKIEKIMIENQCNNYRVLLFALQKIEDIFNNIDNKDKYNLDFLETVMINTIKYVTSDNYNPEKTVDEACFYLFHFMAEYIFNQELCLDEIDTQQQQFLEQQQKLEVNKSLQTIYNFHCENENKLRKAITSIKNQLEENKIMPAEYLKLAECLIKSFSILEISGVETFLQDMLNNIQSKNIQYMPLKRFKGFQLTFNKDEADKLELFEQNIKRLIQENLISTYFDYTTKTIEKFSNYIFDSNDPLQLRRDGLAKRLNIVALLALLKDCTAVELQKLRNIFQYFYSSFNIRDFYLEDKENLETLKCGIEEIINKNTEKLDKIQIFQLNLFVSDLQEILQKLQ